MSKRIFIFLLSAVFLVSAAGFWYYERNSYSKESLKLELLGPDNPQALEDAEYLVKYKNNGDIAFEDVRVTFEYPERAILPEGRQRIQAELVDDIYPGEERTSSFKARLLGAEGDRMVARVKVTYRPRNLKARYESETTHTAVIYSVPLSLELDIPSRVDGGRVFSFWINYFSSAEYPIPDLRVQAAYPSGFSFVGSNPAGFDKNEWKIGLLNKAEGGRIEVRGTLQGEIYEQKNFQATLGIVWNDEFVPLRETVRGVAISKPSLHVTQTVNGSPNYIADPGELLHYELRFRNVGEKPFENLFLALRLEGRPYDLRSIRADRGNFSEGDSAILWDWQNIPELRFLGPGEEGMVDFWVRLKDDWEVLGAGDKNFSVRNIVSLGQAREEFAVKVAAKLALGQSVYFQDELFGNSGPVPPEVGKTTTYTVVWRASSLYNDALDARVRAVLPEQVRLTGKMFPEESRLTFDTESREVVWEAGILSARGPGNGEGASVSFQIELNPASGQKGEAASLIGEARISAVDSWAEAVLEQKDDAVDTTLPDDPSVSSEKGIIGGVVSSDNSEEE